MKIHWVRLIPLITLACAALPNTAFGQDPNFHFYVAHAAPGRNISSTTNPAYPLDISVGTTCIAQGISFGEVRGAFNFAAGKTYPVEITVANTASPCGGAKVFGGEITPAAGTTWVGLLELSSSDQFFASLQSVNLSTVPAGSGRVLFVNTTAENLTGAFTAGDSTGGTAVSKSVTIAGVSSVVTVPSGEYSLTIYPEGSTTAATGPVEADVVSRNVQIYLYAGSTSNQSVQVIGPITIKDVL
jgi:hypothetical protein